MTINAGSILSFFKGYKARAFLSLVVSIMGYVYAVDFIDPNKNVLSQMSSKYLPTDYIFYTGPRGGIYRDIGRELLKAGEYPGISLILKPTAGSSENSIKVATTPRSCGIIVEDTLRRDDTFREHLNYVTPLYLERMHILYRNGDDKSSPDEGKTIISNSKEVIEFFDGATIEAGQHGSGTRVFSDYLLSYLEGVETKKNDGESGPEFTIRNNDFAAALEALEQEQGEVDIVFYIVGAPHPKIAGILKENKEIELMGIDPIVFQTINKDFDLNLRSVALGKEYAENLNVPSFATYSYLVCSKDVPDSVILTFLTILNKNKDKISVPKSNGTYLLDEYDFLQAFKKEYRSYAWNFSRNLFIFIIFVTVASAGTMVFLAWVVSAFRRARYTRTITHVYSTYLPDNAELGDKRSPFPVPAMDARQDEIVSQGIRQLIAITQDLRHDHKIGLLVVNHYNHLIRDIHLAREVFQANLFRFLHEALNRQMSEGDKPAIEAGTVRHYHAAGCLTYDQYEALANLLITVHSSGRA